MGARMAVSSGKGVNGECFRSSRGLPVLYLDSAMKKLASGSP